MALLKADDTYSSKGHRVFSFPRKVPAMAVYVVADLEITDPDEFQKYGQRVVEVVKQYGGRYLIRGGEAEPLEGNWRPTRLTILEFPTAEHVRTWYNSPEYQAILGFRHRSSHTSLILVGGGVAP
jgi:uncharacterized protein (DUF1330 family)